MQSPSRDAPARVLPVALVALAGLLCTIYWPALSGPFLLDDGSNIPQTRLSPFTLGALIDATLANTSGIFGRPIPVASFALNYLFGDGGPFGFKLVNLVIHCLNAVLIYLLCRVVLDACARTSDTAPEHGSPRLAALLAAALWALHPLQLSTVMYAVQRMALLSTTFTVIALALYVSMRLRQLERGCAARHLLPSIALATLLACLSKENGVLILLYIPLLEALLFRFEAPSASARRRFRACFGVCIGLPVLAAAAYFVTHSGSLLSGYALRDFDMGERLLTQASVIVEYLRIILLPSLADMTFYHDGFPVVRELGPAVAGHASVVLAIAALVPLLSRRARVLSLGLGLFLVSHLLESTFLPLEIAFEHRNYTGIVGLALPIGWYGARALRDARTRVGALPLALAALVFLSVQTHARALEWSSDIALHAFAVDNAPESLRARTELSIALADGGDLGGAIRVLEGADGRWPDDAFVPLLLVRQQSLGGSLDPARLADAERRLRNGVLGEYVAALLARMRVDQRAGELDAPDASQLLRLYDAAFDSERRRLRSANEAVLHTLHAELLDETGRAAEAIDALRRAASLSPGGIEIRLRLAEHLVSSGAPARARAALSELESRLSAEDYGRSLRIERLLERLRSGEEVASGDGDL